MSGANEKVYPKDASLLALTGQIAVHFLDGDIIEGEFTTQDAYNIFVTVDNEPMMIPRHQIKFIKGKHVDQLTADNSQSSFVEGQPAPAAAPSPQPEPEPAPDAEASAAPVPASAAESQPEEEAADDDDDDDDDSTFVLSSADIEEFAAVADEEDDDDDETFVLSPITKEPTIDKDDDATFILSADTGHPAASEEDDDDDETFVLSSGIGELTIEDKDEEDDATFVLPPGAGQVSVEEEDEEDGTVVLDSSVEELADTEKAAVVLEEDEDDATMVISEREQLEEKAGLTASLTCTSGPHSGQVFKVEGEMTTLGRSSDNDVPLSSDKEISRHHSIILQESGKFVIQDQDSLNGTFVNNEQVTSPRYLENEDMILVGITTLKYQED